MRRYRVRRLLRRTGSCQRGVSSIEFAIILPMILFGILGTVDVGRAVAQRMSLDEALQTGARLAGRNPGEALVDSALLRAAPTATASLDATRYCACIAAPENVATCNALCPDASVPAIYYRLSATDTFEGMLLPPIPLTAERRVRVR